MHRWAGYLLPIPLAAALVACPLESGGGGGGNPVVNPPPAPSNTPFWAQWGGNPQHDGAVAVVGQDITSQLADIVYDPFVAAEQAEFGGNLVAHYPAPIVDGNDVYQLIKTGSYVSCPTAGDWRGGAQCGPNAWQSQIWNQARYTWIAGALTQIWIFASDWKPEPNGSALGGWEPVFHSVDANNFIYVPGAGGTVWKVRKTDGGAAAHINPFAPGSVSAANTYVAGPLSADDSGNIYYNVIELVSSAGGTVDPWFDADVVSSWLVKITPADVASTVSFAVLVPGAPAGDSVTCAGQGFGNASTLPWPPDTVTTPADVLCGSQRPGVNIAPAIAPDGTVYTASRAHFTSMTAYLIAVNPDLTLKWAASLERRLNNGCGVLLPISPPSNDLPHSCRNGSTLGVDPRTNQPGSGRITDAASSSPTVAPDGSILFGTTTGYNGARGHLFHFSALGDFLNAYDFGWDSTPAIYRHDGTYSIVIKDNHYPTGMYCNSVSSPICAQLPDGPYYITQLDPDMNVEWQFQHTNTESCQRNPNGSVSCVSDHPNGFEWCINMPAVDANGVVYANSEDGRIYTLDQGYSGVFTTPRASLFLNLALGAAYTPLSLGPDGKSYTQNAGHLFVVGE